MAFVDYYKILQVHYTAEHEVIEASYKRLCKKYHPDLRSGEYAEEQMKRINCAYEVLGSKEKRALYHMQWMKINWDVKRAVYSKNENEAEQHNQFGDKAFEVLDGYFSEIINADYFSAYYKLSRVDRQKISQTDFIKWQEAVSKVFTLGSYTIKFFREYDKAIINAATYKKVREYSVEITDKCTKTGKISKECIIKYIVNEGEGWYVNLGQGDIKKLTCKFNRLAIAMTNINYESVYNNILLNHDISTGFSSHEGFLLKANIEAERCRRYGNIFSIAVVSLNKLSPIDKSEKVEYYPEIINTANLIAESIRTTDIAGRWTDDRFVILFTETGDRAACLAMKKLFRLLEKRQENEIFYTAGIAQYSEGNLMECIHKAEFYCSLSRLISSRNSKKYTIIRKVALASVKQFFQKKNTHITAQNSKRFIDKMLKQSY